MLPVLTKDELDIYLRIIDRELHGYKSKFNGPQGGWDKNSPEAKELNRMAEYAIFRTYHETDQRFESTLNNK